MVKPARSYYTVHMTLAFFLGHTPALSLAEIHAVCARRGSRIAVQAWTPEVLLADVEGGEGEEGFFSSLAGVVKIAEMTARIPRAPTADDVRALLPPTSRKIFFGISSSALQPGARPAPAKKLGFAVKEVLEEEGRSSRLVTSREDTLSAVVVNTNKLLSERGAEIVILSTRGGAFLGRTVWVQPYDDYAARDMGRPQRDARAGMLPPKLARMLINLALGADGSGSARARTPAGALLDPFCGSGTILQEASLMGLHRLIGCDRDGQAIKRTHMNLQWLSSLTPAMRASNFSLTLKCVDVRTLPAQLGAGTIEVIVTEPSLGPPLTRMAQPDEARRMREELHGLYRDALHACAQLLAPGGRVVMVWPVWRTPQGNVPMDAEADAAATGLRVVDPLNFAVNPLPDERHGFWAARRSLLYQREDQFVMREIRIFEKA